MSYSKLVKSRFEHGFVIGRSRQVKQSESATDSDRKGRAMLRNTSGSIRIKVMSEVSSESEVTLGTAPSAQQCVHDGLAVKRAQVIEAEFPQNTSRRGVFHEAKRLAKRRCSDLSHLSQHRDRNRHK